MAEYSGYKCDNPNCNNQVDKKAEQASRWLLVNIATGGKRDGYKQDFTFCSYDCLEGYSHETVVAQRVD